ncbi:unnamed protein product [Aureobasidium mustum]|uniref:Uncharacterized protein n=1 Tax=Aureobasidium mustum TaxID=2773714 RepID=A0A9N8PCH3_9PEZI|nr:unnamed protein product [Aureobasidium mustum]
MGLLRFDSLHNATKKVLYPDVVAAILQNQFCIATKALGMLIRFEEPTQFAMPSDVPNKGSHSDEEWVSVETGGLDDSWVEVNKDVPNDTGRGSSDIPGGISRPCIARIVLRIVKESYDEEDKEEFNWRMENTKK